MAIIAGVGAGTFSVAFFAAIFLLSILIGRLGHSRAPPLFAGIILGIVILITATLPTSSTSTAGTTTTVSGAVSFTRSRNARRRFVPR